MPAAELEKICVILGAGASFDVAGEGAPIIQRDFQPPMARDLFNIAKHKVYWEIMERYNGAKVLAQRLASISLSGQISIEEELRRYAEHRDSQIRQHFKYIPPYLRDLIYRASVQYTHMPSNYVRLVCDLLAEYPHDVLFLILNYDNLLEFALSHFDPKFSFMNVSDYVADGRQAKVVKLHGSIDWFHLLPKGPDESWENHVARFDVSTLHNEEIWIDKRVQVVADQLIKNQHVYPVLTAPLAGKGIADAVCPASHIGVAREFMGSCYKFLIIGSSGLDEDLMALLDRSVDPTANTFVQVVGSKNAEAVLQRFETKVKAFRKFHRAPFHKAFGGGFRSHFSQAEWVPFLNDPGALIGKLKGG